MNTPVKTICVFCGSALGSELIFQQTAAHLGKLLAENGITLVYGGAHVGTMGVLADACLQAGGRVIGVMPQRLVDREVAHRGLTELIIVETMHQRKAKMVELSDAFIALPGGFGTYDELFEILTWAQIGVHHKPIGLVNVAEFYTPLLTFLQSGVDKGFVQRRILALLNVTETAAQMVGLLRREPVAV